MQFQSPLERGLFLKRYKRFFADIKTPQGVEIAHVANTGSLKGVTDLPPEEKNCLFTRVNDPNRKLQLTLEAIEVNGNWVGVNTSWPNKIVAEAFSTQKFSHWSEFDQIQSEVKISSESRIDLVLWNSKKFPAQKLTGKDVEKGSPFHLVEIKNVTLAKDGTAMFPDAVTERGQKHLEELISYAQKGATAEIFFVVQRSDCQLFKAANHIDPKYASLLKKAHEAGVLVTASVAELTEKSISLSGKTLPVEFE